MTWPTRVLMVDPTHYDIHYAINPHMVDKTGNLNKVNRAAAKKQWTDLKKIFEQLKLKVEVLKAEESLPDMVFCANQTFPFLKEGQLQLILSNMGSLQRQPEVEVFRKWALENDYPYHEIDNAKIEGMGDVLWNYDKEEIYAGYGFRTSPETFQKLESIIGKKIFSFELVDERFYHLDTCLSIINGETVAYVREAFTEKGYTDLKQKFKNLIQVPLHEALNSLACNMCSPNGKDIIIQEGADLTCEALSAFGFNVIEVDTGEYLKSGGSVFCMKMLLP